MVSVSITKFWQLVLPGLEELEQPLRLLTLEPPAAEAVMFPQPLTCTMSSVSETAVVVVVVVGAASGKVPLPQSIQQSPNLLP